MINYLISQLKYFFIYIKIINKIKFDNINNNINGKKIILCELNNFTSIQIPFFYILNYFCKKKSYKLKCFYNYTVLKHSINENIFQIFIRKNILNFFIKKIYKYFGISEFIYPYSKNNEKLILQKNIKKVLNLKSKKELVNFKINGVLIGDLLYDTYCKKFFEPTIDFKDERFKLLTKEFLILFNYWNNYFIHHSSIEKVLSSHGVYSYAIILRIALKFKKDVYLVSLDRIKKLNPKTPFEVHYSDFDIKQLNKLNKKNKVKIVKKGKLILDNILKGNEKSFNIVSTLKKNSFLKNSQKSLITKNNKIKVLISPHDFYDAPHVWGDHGLFSDYYEWLNYLFKLSKKTNYDWYLKTHPDLVGQYGANQRQSRNILQSLTKDYKNIKILPPNYSNYRLVKDKINFVITCHGSVAYEFPYFKIPTITCSKSNPFIEYKFNIHSKSIKNLEEIVLNLNKYKNKIRINKEEIYKYFANRFVFYNTNDWLFNFFDYTNFVKAWHMRDGPELFEYWIKNYKKIDFNRVNLIFDKFIDSKKTLMNISHID